VILLISLCIMLIQGFIVWILGFIVWILKLIASKQFWSLLIGFLIAVIRNRVPKFLRHISTKQAWSWILIISSIGIFFILFLILVAFNVISTNDNLKDFAGNLAVEGIGIAFTVFIIDRLIKRREKMRLLESKQIVYGRILLIIDRPLEAMSELFPGEYFKPTLNIYMYSSTRIVSSMSFDNLSTLHASISTYVEQYIEERIRVQDSTNITPIKRSNIYNSVPLSTAIDHIHNILSASNFLLEPELRDLLLQFDLGCANLKHYTDLMEKFPISRVKFEEIMQKMVLVDYIEKTMRSAINIRE
jgi:hypothetical protein